MDNNENNTYPGAAEPPQIPQNYEVPPQYGNTFYQQPPVSYPQPPAGYPQPPERNSRDKRRNDLLELISLIMLGITSIVIAFATFMSAILGGEQQDKTNAAAEATTKGNIEYNSAIQRLNIDQIFFSELKDCFFDIVLDDFNYQMNYENHNADSDRLHELNKLMALWKCFLVMEAYYPSNSMLLEKIGLLDLYMEYQQEKEKPGGDTGKQCDKLWEWYFDVDDAYAVFESEEYLKGYTKDAEKYMKEAEVLKAEAEKYNERGDKFQFVVVLYTVTMFFLGLVGKFGSYPKNIAILVMAAVTFLIATVYMAGCFDPSDIELMKDSMM